MKHHACFIKLFFIFSSLIKGLVSAITGTKPLSSLHPVLGENVQKKRLNGCKCEFYLNFCPIPQSPHPPTVDCTSGYS